MTQNPQASNTEAQRARGRSYLTWGLILLTFFAVVAAPSMLLLATGMLPTLVALLIDRTTGKSATITVGSINFIGVFPYLITLWSGFNSIGQAMEMISDLFILLVMYCAAAMGWLIFLMMPTLISSFITVLQQRRVAQLRGEQKEMIDEWGAEVAALVEMKKLEQREDQMAQGGGGLDMEVLE